MSPHSKLVTSILALSILGLALLTHGGREFSVAGADHQELGNPLRVRRALDLGVTVVLAHCGTLGDSSDLDAETIVQRGEVGDLAHRQAPRPRGGVGLGHGAGNTCRGT